MFSVVGSDKLVVEEGSFVEQDLRMDDIDVSIQSCRKRQRKTPQEKVRKIMHRDIERQRRQQMTTLYASLRDLLPLQYIKGKRSTSDHMHEAVNYIKHMERNVKELQLRRDKLKNVSISSSSSNENSVRVNWRWDGAVDILIESANGIPLSTVLLELLHTQLHILTATSAKQNQRFLYTIHSQVNTLAYINLYELRQTLTNLIN